MARKRSKDDIMSEKSAGSHLLVPDNPVKQYSPLLNSYFEMLHRTFTNMIKIENVKTGNSRHIDDHERAHFYSIRKLLEEDYGIHPYTAEHLKIPDYADALQWIYKTENDFGSAKKEFVKRAQNPNLEVHPSFYSSYWKKLRMNIWELGRCLSICQERIARVDTKYPSANPDTPPRYYWIN